MSDAINSAEGKWRAIRSLYRLGQVAEFEAMMAGRGFYRCDSLNESDTMPSPEDRTPCAATTANLVGSLCTDGLHRPVLDIDIPAALIPSSTPGHHHLYLNVGMSLEKYLKLVEVLEEVGIVSPFYAMACRVRGQSFCRVPWIAKEEKLKKEEESL